MLITSCLFGWMICHNEMIETMTIGSCLVNFMKYSMMSFLTLWNTWLDGFGDFLLCWLILGNWNVRKLTCWVKNKKDTWNGHSRKWLWNKEGKWAKVEILDHANVMSFPWLYLMAMSAYWMRLYMIDVICT